MRFLLFILAFLIALPAGAEAPQNIALTSRERPVLYGTAWCPYCKAARTWFRNNRITFIDCDVETDASCRKQFAALRQQHGVSGVPMIVYQGEMWGGFDEYQMQEIGDLYAKTFRR